MKVAAIAHLARAAQPAPGAARGPSAAQLPAPAPREDLDLFAQALRAPLPRPALKPAGGTGALDELSSSLRRSKRMVAAQMERLQVTRDPAAMLQITNELIDQGVQSDLIAKVIGKSVSGIDQLTKLN